MSKRDYFIMFLCLLFFSAGYWSAVLFSKDAIIKDFGPARIRELEQALIDQEVKKSVRVVELENALNQATADSKYHESMSDSFRMFLEDCQRERKSLQILMKYENSGTEKGSSK